MKFQYTDSEGNTYDYFDNGDALYIYKNMELMGAVKANRGDLFGCLSLFFGIKPN